LCLNEPIVQATNSLGQIMRKKLDLDFVLLELEQSLATYTLIRVEDADNDLSHLRPDQAVAAGFTLFGADFVGAWFQCCIDGCARKISPGINLRQTSFFGVVFLASVVGSHHLPVNCNDGTDSWIPVGIFGLALFKPSNCFYHQLVVCHM